MKLQLNKKISAKDRLKTHLALAAGSLMRTGKSPEEVLGEFFEQVQQSQVFADGKTFVDLVPRKRLKAIYTEYQMAKQDPHFNLDEFVKRHFYEFAPHKRAGKKLPHNRESIDEHIDMLWSDLTRRNRKNRGSLITLPHHYIVPGGRFSEQFYWDTYFIMLGLAADGYWDDIEAMMKNYAYMIRKFGFIPTANRTYFLSRSQPPFLALMVQLLARKKGKQAYIEYLPYLMAEYRFWMKGRGQAKKHAFRAHLRVVEMPNGTFLNRYFDNKSTPRPESHREDVETVNGFDGDEATDKYLHLRSGAESGWDFSSRWFQDKQDIHTIRTSQFVPVDLNCLMFELEQTIARAYEILGQSIIAGRYRSKARKRAEAISMYCWNKKLGWFTDYDVVTELPHDQRTLAGAYALYVNIADSPQAEKMSAGLQTDFLKRGGLVTTLINNGQQWDAPNGWAPLQWVAIQGLRKYGYDELADEVKSRWMKLVEQVYDSHHVLIEKYDVESEIGLGGGGEYALQEGFGWTNGVYRALKTEDFYDATRL